jgi:GNAT superfamily N-acetyltransferase
MDGEFQVRTARLADAESIYALIREHTTELVPRSLDNVVENIDRFLVAEGSDGVLAGCIAYQVWPEIGDPLKATVELQSVAVRAACRRRGIGSLLVKGALARVRALAQMVACDIHPLNNLRVMQYLEQEWNAPQPERDEWVKHWMREGFAAFEGLLADNPATSDFCDGDAPGLADCCLIPQLYNAHRFGVDLAPYPTLIKVEANCLRLPAFAAARPERQPDAPNNAG